MQLILLHLRAEVSQPFIYLFTPYPYTKLFRWAVAFKIQVIQGVIYRKLHRQIVSKSCPFQLLILYTTYSIIIRNKTRDSNTMNISD